MSNNRNHLKLLRAYTPQGTIGKLLVRGKEQCWVLENPWKSNKQNVSCVPPGVYSMKRRESPVVERSTSGEFTGGWEITDVPERSWIMIHPGNTIDDTEGCPLPGKTQTIHNNKQFVGQSRDAFRELMTILDEETEWTIEIMSWQPEYP